VVIVAIVLEQGFDLTAEILIITAAMSEERITLVARDP